MHPDYNTLIRTLYQVNLHSGMKLGLQNMERLCTALGNPQKKFKSVHIAGTNGKGSVSTKIHASLQAAGYRTGLYTSPHISCFRERIRLEEQMITEEEVSPILSHLFKVIQNENIPATFFEITTAAAFQFFAEKEAEWVVLETGLGGRLDATNVILPELCVITSIGLEHTEILGSTLEAITKEKCGIIKSGIPVIIGPKVSKQLVQEAAAPLGSSVSQSTTLPITYDEENNGIAEKAMHFLRLPPAAIKQGLAVRPPCRMEIPKKYPNVILDVAHNPDGLYRLFESIKEKFPRKNVAAVCGFSKNKDLPTCLEIIQNYSDSVQLIAARNVRAAPPDLLHDILLKQNYPAVKTACWQNIEQGIAAGLSNSSDKANSICIICGTFFIMADVRKYLGFNEPCDMLDIN